MSRVIGYSTCSAVLMIRPVAFGRNEETAESNSFMVDPDPDIEIHPHALAEFDGVVESLKREGVQVIVFSDRPVSKGTVCPDAVFPNNWISTHPDGTVVLYPMLAPSRRRERRMDVIESLPADHGLLVRNIFDLTHFEEEGKYLEGTRSMVLDHRNQTCFACLSPRTHESPLRAFAERLGYEVITFRGFDESGVSIYHTNVMLMLGADFAVLCPDAIRSPTERQRVFDQLESGGRTIIPITFTQMRSFAANLLALLNNEGEQILIMSSTAQESLNEDQLSRLSTHTRLVVIPVPTIERVSGGGVRCMLAEILLPNPPDSRPPGIL